MHYGFTGTRNGMTAKQLSSLINYLELPDGVTSFHHGCCVGADEQAVVAVAGGSVAAPIYGYPSNIPDLTSEIAKHDSDEVDSPEPPLVRNRTIVDACEILLAAPGRPETTRSGTWSTVRYARRTLKRVVIFWPNGDVEEE